MLWSDPQPLYHCLTPGEVVYYSKNTFFHLSFFNYSFHTFIDLQFSMERCQNSYPELLCFLSLAFPGRYCADSTNAHLNETFFSWRGRSRALPALSSCNEGITCNFCSVFRGCVIKEQMFYCSVLMDITYQRRH